MAEPAAPADAGSPPRRVAGVIGPARLRPSFWPGSIVLVLSRTATVLGIVIERGSSRDVSLNQERGSGADSEDRLRVRVRAPRC